MKSMITLELTLIDQTTGRDAEKIFLVGDRFSVTNCNMKWGKTERTITIINDGLIGNAYVAESYQDVKDMIRNKMISRIPK